MENNKSCIVKSIFTRKLNTFKELNVSWKLSILSPKHMSTDKLKA